MASLLHLRRDIMEQRPQETDGLRKKKTVVKFTPSWGLVQRQHATLWTWKLGFESLIPSLDDRH
jgi:hypothetical protein